MARVVLHESISDNKLFHINKNSFLGKLTLAAGIILLYFPLSIGLTFYQRWFLQKYHYPLFVVMVHIATKYSISVLCRWIWKMYCQKPRVRLNWSIIIYRIAPMGFVSGLDIAFSNWGLEFITVSLYTMTKSTSVIFILLFAILMKLEEKSWSLIGIVGMIAGGLILFTYHATQFDLLGFLLVLFASFSSGLRWTLAQFIMQKVELDLSNPLDMIYLVQPWMLISILPFAVTFEGADAWKAAIDHLSSGTTDWNIVMYLAYGSLIALLMELTEFLIIGQMSSLTLSIAGIFKEICTLTLAIEWNGDEMSKLNFFGLVFCMGGIILHVIHKARIVKNTQDEHSTSLSDEASALFLADISSSENEDEQDDSSTEVLFSVLRSRDR